MIYITHSTFLILNVYATILPHEGKKNQLKVYKIQNTANSCPWQRPNPCPKWRVVKFVFVNGGQHFQSTCKRIFIIKIKTGNYLLRDMCSMDKCRNRPDKKRIWLFYVCTFYRSCELYIYACIQSTITNSRICHINVCKYRTLIFP